MRIKFITKRNKRKRQRDVSAKKSEQVSPVKRVKTDNPSVEVKVIETELKDESVKPDTKDKSQSNLAESIKSETNTELQTDVGKIANVEDGNSSINEDIKVKPDDETDEDEDPEEDPEEDEEMPDGSPRDSANVVRIFNLLFMTQILDI